MAAVSSLYGSSFSPSFYNKGANKCGKQPIVCRKNICEPETLKEKKLFVRTSDEEEGLQTVTRRRQAMLQMAFTAFSFPVLMSNAIAGNDIPEGFRDYTDDVNKFNILIPQDWQVGSAEPDGFKSITAFYPEEAASSSNVSVAITGLGPDFTRMESFGKVEAFAETLVSGLDRSWQRPPGVAAKLLDCKASKGFYYIEYTLQNPGEGKKHLYTAIGMASNGWYNRLYTVTGQYLEEESEKYGSRIEKAVASFKFI